MQTLPVFGLAAVAGNVGAMSVDSPGKWGRGYTQEVVENYKNIALNFMLQKRINTVFQYQL